MAKLYRHFDKDSNLLYVGISLCALGRLIQHRTQSHWYDEIETIRIETYPSRKDAIRAETIAIAREKPKHNIVGQTSRPFTESEISRDDGSLSTEELIALIQTRCIDAGGIKPWAESQRPILSFSYVAMVLRGQREPSAKLSNAIGYRRVIRFEAFE